MWLGSLHLVRSLVVGIAFVLLLAGCRTGSIEAVPVENPEVAAAAVPTRAVPTAIPEVQPTPTVAPEPVVDDERQSNESTGQADESNDDDPVASAQAPATQPAQSGGTEPPETEPTAEPPAADDGAADESAAAAALLQDDVDPLTLDVGVVLVDPDDPWCVVAEQVNENYRAVSAVDPADPVALEAVFRQTYDSVQVAAEIAPVEIEAEAEIERSVWSQVVDVHADASWLIGSVDSARIDELGESNADALQAVDDYTARTCG